MGDSLAIAVSNDDAGDQRLDAAGFVAAELAMRDIKPGSLPQGMSKEQWKIGNIIPAWKRREPTLKLGYKSYKTFGAALASEKTSRCTPRSPRFPRFNCMRIFSYTVSWFLRD